MSPQKQAQGPQHKESSESKKTAQKPAPQAGLQSSGDLLSDVIRAEAGGLKPAQVLVLQRTTGNQWVQRRLQSELIQRQNAPTGNPTPIPALSTFESRTKLAEEILKKAYGDLIKKGASTTEKVASADEMYTKYDEAMVSDNRFNKETNGKWKSGDAKKHPQMSKGLYGFQFGGKVYIDTSQPMDQQVVTTVHEMLHNNASGDFASVMGKSVDEGMTEKLTQQAIAASGYASAGPAVFQGEMGLIGQFEGLVGANTMKYAYFRGTDPLKSAVDAMFKSGTFEILRNYIKRGDFTGLAAKIERLRNGDNKAEIEKKIETIRNLMGWIVTDANISSIESIWNLSSPEEQTQIRNVLLPMVTSLNDFAQRARLRIMMGG
jgi:hypothetical protein